MKNAGETPKSVVQEVRDKLASLNTIIEQRFGSGTGRISEAEGGVPGDKNHEEGGDMRITRSSTSGAPGPVEDGKLVNLKDVHASAGAGQDLPPTDLMALAKASDPHNEQGAAGAVIEQRAERGEGPGFPEAKTPDNGLGDLEKAQKTMQNAKERPPIEKALETDVRSQTSTGDPYKTLHANQDITSVVERARAIKKAANDLAKINEGEVEAGEGVPAGSDPAKSPQATGTAIKSAKAEGHPEDPVPSSSDAAKTPEELASSWGTESLPSSVLKASLKTRLVAMLKAAKSPEAQEFISKEIKHLEEDKGFPQDRAVGAAHNIAREKGYSVPKAAGAQRVAESKDRPLASMPEGKARYDQDEDGRDKEAESYWAKHKKDEARYRKEWGTDRPINRETGEKMPALSPNASVKRDLITRIAGLEFVAAMSDDEAARLRAKSVRYPRDKEKDMEFADAAKRTTGEIKKEQSARENDTHTFSPMMSRLWSAVGWTRTAALPAAPEHVGPKAGERRSQIQGQIKELKTALQAVKGDERGADRYLAAIGERIARLESELGTVAGIGLRRAGDEAMQDAAGTLSEIPAVLRAVSDVLAAHHAEMRFAADDEFPPKDKGEDKEPKDEPKDEPKGDDKPEAKDDKGPKKDKGDKKPKSKAPSDKAMKLLRDLGETLEDMSAEIEDLLKAEGLGKKKGPGEQGGLPGLPPLGEPPLGGPGGMDKEMPLPSVPEPAMGGAEVGAPLEPGLEKLMSADGKFLTAAAEEAAVAAVISDKDLTSEARSRRIAEIRSRAQWNATFTKLASAADKTKPDIEASFWTVKRDGEVVLRASVKDLYPVEQQAEKDEAFKWASSREYGTMLLAAVKNEGLERTAGRLGIAPMVRSAAATGKTDPGTYYRQVYPGSFVKELMADHEKKAAADRATVEKRASAAEAETKELRAKLARQTEDIALHAKAEKALAVVGMAVSKGLVASSDKDRLVDEAMQMDDKGFEAYSRMIQASRSAGKSPVEGEKREASVEVSARELIRRAAAGPGLKSAVVIPSTEGGAADMKSRLEGIWKSPSAKPAV